ncbi:terminase large subunit domain-containing protein [Propionivibrio dicarboxylicus]|nr:terminase family protein [Propionivibrio dicarboxylicus]
MAVTSPGRTVSLNYHPREWQRRCHLERRRFTVLALHRRAGKTELALRELVDKALRFNLNLGLFFYVAPFLKQAKAIAWLRLKQIVEPLRQVGAVEVLENELSVTFAHNDAVVRVYGADNPDAMRGVRLDGVVIDEVADIKPEVWEDIVQPALADRKGWALFIGTPHGINLFSELFYKAQSLPDWFSARFTVYDTDALDPDEVTRMRRDMTETAFSREMLCDFSAAGDDQVLSLADCESAAQRHLPPHEYDYAPRVIGVDPARFGDDRSVIVKRQGRVAFPPIVRHKVDNMQLAGLVASLIDEWEPDAVFIDAGNGAGVIDRLRQLGHDVIEVHFGGRASSPEYANKRDEIIFATADWVRAGGCLPNDPAIKQDLAAATYYFDVDNRKRVESKDDIKKRGLPSPDIADALALTFSHPVARKRRGDGIPRRQGMLAREYDPYADLGRTLDMTQAEHNPYANP